MSMKRDNNETRAIGAGLSIGHNNARYKTRITCYNTYMNDALQTSNLPDLASTSARVSVASIVSKGQTTMTSIFIVSSDTSSDIAFASIGTALQYIRDSHGDENPEGCTLMLQTPSGLVPESTTAVRARADLTLPCRFRAVDSDAAGRGAKIRSDLDGCLKGAALLGVDPESVAKIHELRADLEAETANVAAEADTVGYSLTVMRLHKRKGARRN